MAGLGMKKRFVLGVISDTHGLARPQALSALRGVDGIVHAGDIGSPEVLAELGKIAPVTAIRGNNDTAPWARHLPETAVIQAGGLVLYVIHDVHDLNLDPRAAGFAAVISGHSHKPHAEWRDGVLFFNPGSAGPRRFRLPVALGYIAIGGRHVSSELITLEV